jgi:hypothetical protein
MKNGDITFGWVIYPVPRGFSDEEMATPQSAARALMRANESYIEAMQPHFDTVWVEDHFQWDNRPVLEAVTTLTYLAGRHETVKFGHIVLGQSYRNPALTAKMAANLQLMTASARAGKRTSTEPTATLTRPQASASTNWRKRSRLFAPSGQSLPPTSRAATTPSRTPSASPNPTLPSHS